MIQNEPILRPATEEEKKIHTKGLIRREGNRWGFVTVISMLSISTLMVGLFVIAEFLPDLDFFLETAEGELVQQIGFSALMFTVPYIIGAAISRQKVFKQLISLKWRKPGKSIPLIMMGLGGAMAINLLVGQLLQFIEGFGLDTSTESMAIPDTLWGSLLYLFTLSVVPAIVEEFAFRGVILGSMKKYGTGYAVIASATLFGLMHGNIVQIPFATALGLIMGYVAVATDSIWPSVVIHFLNNFIAGVQGVTQQNCSTLVSSLVIYGSFIVCLVLGIVGFILLNKVYKDPFSPIKERSVLTVTESSKAALFSPGYIVSLIFFGGTACLELLPPDLMNIL